MFLPHLLTLQSGPALESSVWDDRDEGANYSTEEKGSSLSLLAL